ncbi:MAG: M10 family metallopeptidase C-terminal domain-containing protein [Hyphomicrobiaceae bacterium]
MANVFGTNWRDVLTGTSGADSIFGYGDDDTIFGSRGNDFIDGGTGSDTIDYSGNLGATTVALGLNGGMGNAQTSYATWSVVGGHPVATYHNETDTLRSIENVVGSRWNDTITGNERDNTIAGLGGADTIDAGGGIDTIDYSASNAAVFVNLTIGGNWGGHATGDILDGFENVRGSQYRDSITGTAGDNVLEGGGDNDTLTGLGGADTLNGGDGSDTANYFTSQAPVYVNLTTGIATGGDAQGDRFISIENVTGSLRSDWLVGDAQSNRLEGLDLNDYLDGRGGADILDGGDGIDRAIYQYSPAGVVINLLTGQASGGDAEGDTLTSIEDVTGSNHADHITGNFEDNRLDGLDDDDVLAGLDGADDLYGGEGNDTADYSDSPFAVFSGVIVDLRTGVGSGYHAEGDRLYSIENVIGSDAWDTLIGNDEANTLDGGLGQDTLAGLGGADTLIGGDGPGIDFADYSLSPEGIYVNLTTLEAGGGHAEGDTLMGIEGVFGSKYSDKIIGDDNDNIILGYDNDDHLDAGAGNDEVFGGEGDDSLVGGLGRDSLRGEEGADTFIYTSVEDSPYEFVETGLGPQRLYDDILRFVSGEDTLDLRQIDADVLTQGNQAFHIVDEFSGVAGELMITDPANAGDGYFLSTLMGDVDGDGVADFAIELVSNLTASAQIVESDILL